MLIIGTGALASDILSSLQYDGINEIVFYQDTANEPKSYIRENFRILANDREVREYFSQKDERFISAVGDNYGREKVARKMEALGGSNISYISGRALVGRFAKVDPRGVIIMHHAVVGNDCHIGEGSIVYVNASLGHDSLLGKYVLVSGQVCMSNVSIGDYTSIGIGSVFKPGVAVGSNVQIGTGTVVIRNIAENSIVVGNPGRVIHNGGA